MKVSEIDIRLVNNGDEQQLKAFASMLLDDCFVVKEIRIICDSGQRYFVSMPSRKLTDRCPNCTSNNNLRSRFCHMCGTRRKPDRAIADSNGKTRYNSDIAHPITTEARVMIERAILEAYLLKVDEAKSYHKVSEPLRESA
jgi:stage V sporulation protein G